MTIKSTNAYADGFGMWHVDITQTGVGNDAEAEAAARRIIRDELQARQGAPVVDVRVTLVSRASAYGEVTSFYREV